MRIDEFSRHESRESQATFQEAHLTNTGVAGKSELNKRFWRIARCRIDFAVGNYPTFPVDRQSFQVLATEACDLIFAWYIGKRFRQSTCANRYIIDAFMNRMLHSSNLNATVENLVRPRTGRPAPRSEERNRETQ